MYDEYSITFSAKMLVMMMYVCTILYVNNELNSALVEQSKMYLNFYGKCFQFVNFYDQLNTSAEYCSMTMIRKKIVKSKIQLCLQ